MVYSSRGENPNYWILPAETVESDDINNDGSVETLKDNKSSEQLRISRDEAELLNVKRKAVEKIRAMADKALQSSDNPKKPVKTGVKEWRASVKIAANMATHEVIYATNIEEVEQIDISIPIYLANKTNESTGDLDSDACEQLEIDLRKAILEQQLYLDYQLQVDIEKKPIGAEVLLRWKHPEKGLISPIEFLPIAEGSEVITELGKWVLHSTCRQLAIWSQNENFKKMHLAINVSKRQLQSPTLLDDIEEVLNIHNITPSSLMFELTEDAILNSDEDDLEVLQALRELGVRLVLDDFGVGSSSLSKLIKLPFHQIKIDKSFIKEISSNDEERNMVRAVIDIARDFGFDVIAEGVESESQFDFLKKNGCMKYQGYLIGKPMPIEDFEKILAINLN